MEASLLPFLRKKQEAGLGQMLHKTREPDQPEAKDDSSAAHEACAEALIRAIDTKDAKAVVAAMQDLMDVMSQVADGDDSTYAHQNRLAAKEAKE